MRKMLLIGALAVSLSGCEGLGATLDAIDVLLEPTDRQICENTIVGGRWIGGECLVPLDRG